MFSMAHGFCCMTIKNHGPLVWKNQLQAHDACEECAVCYEGTIIMTA